MDQVEFALPDLGEGLTEGEILQWLVAEGDTVTLNQPIVEVETAKAAVEIPSPHAGQVQALLRDAGETVATGTPIIRFGVAAAAGQATKAPETKESPAAGRQAVLVGYGPKEAGTQRRARKVSPTSLLPTIPDDVTTAAKPVRHGGLELGRAVEEALAAAPVSPPPQRAVRNERVLAKPPVRKLARDLGVDLARLTGTGAGGVITRSDVEGAAVGLQLGATGSSGAAEERVPVRGVRKVTAEAMVASAFTAPHVTCFLDVDVTSTVELVARLRQAPEFSEVRLGPLAVIARAVVAALGRHPLVNSAWNGDEIIIKKYVNLGIAAATERGLLVPVIRDAHALGLAELSAALSDLTATARAGRTSPAEMSGGTFTISNIGVFGVDAGTPIIPPGQTAILALGAITPRPWVSDSNELVVRQVCTLSLSFDHRVIDGEQGSRFLADVGRILRDPATTLWAWG